MDIETLISAQANLAVQALYGLEPGTAPIQIQQTRKEFTGDATIVVFPLSKAAKKAPDAVAHELGAYLCTHADIIESYNVVKGYLNLCIASRYWIEQLDRALADADFGCQPIPQGAPAVMVEYSSPNTNKPLHLGHIRNNLLGWSVAKILEANGQRVIKANLINDRGIHICKSMLAWQKFGMGETPESSGLKGDHLVGKYYVLFDKAYKAEIEILVNQGVVKEQAEKDAPIMGEAREMLRLWEAGDKETVELWETMNNWVYAGFDKTYKRLGVSFDKVYYESQTYLLGKQIVLDGLASGVLYHKEDNSVWANLEEDGLDHKLLLRPDGTSVYMTQDLGTAVERFREYANLDGLTYVVGNEQNYHFQVLALILKKLGYSWADKIYHLSYGMVELPEGKMKSREGTVVDADDLMEEMYQGARAISQELGKLDGLSEEQQRNTVEMIAQAALKYFMLKVEPRKTMLFNPKESIDFNGNTGPFIQYTHARIRSLLRKAETEDNRDIVRVTPHIGLGVKETQLVKCIMNFPLAVADAGREHNPSAIAAYIYELCKEFNQFYHDHPIIKEQNAEMRQLRLVISLKTAEIIKRGMDLLGISVPERM